MSATTPANHRRDQVCVAVLFGSLGAANAAVGGYLLFTHDLFGCFSLALAGVATGIAGWIVGAHLVSPEEYL